MTQSSKCLDDDILYKYIDHQLSEKELKRVDRHLNECPTCLTSLSSLIKLATAPVTDEEKKIVESIEKVPVEERLEGIFRFPIVDPPLSISKKINNFFQSIFYQTTQSASARSKFPKLAYAYAAFLAVLMGWAGLHFATRTLPIILAERTISQHYSISSGEVRLHGDYRYNRISQYMDEDSEQFYLESSKEYIRKAQKHHKKSLKASLLLGQTFIIQNEFQKADSVLQHVLQNDTTLIAAVNDIGVLYFQQNRFKDAEVYFQKCIDLDSQYLQAYYNLSLTKHKLGKRDEAIILIQHYINFEKNETWNNVAQNLLRDYKENNDMNF